MTDSWDAFTQRDSIKWLLRGVALLQIGRLGSTYYDAWSGGSWWLGIQAGLFAVVITGAVVVFLASKRGGVKTAIGVACIAVFQVVLTTLGHMAADARVPLRVVADWEWIKENPVGFAVAFSFSAAVELALVMLAWHYEPGPAALAAPAEDWREIKAPAGEEERIEFHCEHCDFKTGVQPRRTAIAKLNGHMKKHRGESA